MSWSKVEFLGPNAAADLEAFRRALMHAWWDIEEDDRAAVYQDCADQTLYLTPRATELAIGIGRRPVAIARPNPANILLRIGASLAHDPLWADLTEDERDTLRRDPARNFDYDPPQARP